MQSGRSQFFTRAPLTQNEHGPLYGSHPGQSLLEIQKRLGLPQGLGGSGLLGIGMRAHGFFTTKWLISKTSWIITNNLLLHGQGISALWRFFITHMAVTTYHNES